MLGSIIGDIAGSRFEFNNHRSKEFELFTKDCFVTDDSIMTLAVAKAILACDGDWKQLEENSVKYMQSIGRKYPDCGYGGMFSKWMFSDKPKPYNSFGNGAAMRVSACGFIAQTEKEAKKLSKKVTGVTHNHPEGIKGAEAVVIAIFLARMGSSKNEIKERIEKDYYKLDFTLGSIREHYQFNETCQDTVPQAIQAFLESVSFEDAIRNAISIGGDSDTLAAITGGIAEAYYGIPVELKRKAQFFLNAELRSIYKEWNRYIKRLYPEKKFLCLTKYINKLDSIDIVNNFKNVFFNFLSSHTEYSIEEFEEILMKNGLVWKAESMKSADVSKLDESCIIALIIGVFRAEYYAKGVYDEFVKKGFLENWLNRLKTLDEERKIEDEKPHLNKVKITLQLFGLEGKNELLVTDRGIIFKYDTHDNGCVTYQYDFGDEAESSGEQILNKMNDCLCAEGWTDEQNITSTDFIRHLFQLEAEYEDGKKIKHYGLFDRAHIPEKPFIEFIETIKNTINVNGFGDIINLSGFMNVLKPGEVKYCGVEFTSRRIYHYRTTDTRIKTGDRIIVPVGEYNYEKIATVKTIVFCCWDDTPYPLEETKEIIRLIDGNNRPDIPYRSRNKTKLICGGAKQPYPKG